MKLKSVHAELLGWKKGVVSRHCDVPFQYSPGITEKCNWKDNSCCSGFPFDDIVGNNGAFIRSTLVRGFVIPTEVLGTLFSGLCLFHPPLALTTWIKKSEVCTAVINCCLECCLQLLLAHTCRVWETRGHVLFGEWGVGIATA